MQCMANSSCQAQPHPRHKPDISSPADRIRSPISKLYFPISHRHQVMAPNPRSEQALITRSGNNAAPHVSIRLPSNAVLIAKSERSLEKSRMISNPTNGLRRRLLLHTTETNCHSDRDRLWNFPSPCYRKEYDHCIPFLSRVMWALKNGKQLTRLCCGRFRYGRYDCGVNRLNTGSKSSRRPKSRRDGWNCSGLSGIRLDPQF